MYVYIYMYIYIYTYNTHTHTHTHTHTQLSYTTLVSKGLQTTEACQQTDVRRVG